MNDVQLYGKSRREVVAFLKEVPPPFTLVCCRHPTSDLEQDPGSETESEPEPVLQPGLRTAGRSEVSVDEVREEWRCQSDTVQINMRLTFKLIY